LLPVTNATLPVSLLMRRPMKRKAHGVHPWAFCRGESVIARA
jgi:hypothetical protein